MEDMLVGKQRDTDILQKNQGSIYPGQINPERFQKAFVGFAKIAEGLDRSYQLLDRRLQKLKREMAKTRIAYQQELQEKQKLANRLAAMVTAIPSAVLVVNRQGLIVDCNEKAVEFFGEPLIGWGLNQLQQRESLVFGTDDMEIHLADGRILSQQSRPLAGTTDLAYFFSDITEVHRERDEVARRQRLAVMGELTAGMAHQIRTPLSSAHLYLSKLNSKRLAKEQRESALCKLQERLNHVGSLVDSMLSFVRSNKKNQEILSLDAVLELVAALVKQDLNQSRSQLEITGNAASIFIRAEAQSLAGAIANLILNALDMTKSEVHISINVCALSNSRASLVIADNGPGIHKEHIDKIFDPFFTTRPTGTGLGLAVTAATIKDLGGSISVKNRTAGGAEFYIELPKLDAFSIQLNQNTKEEADAA